MKVSINYPTLNETAELVKNCIQSCRTMPQLSTCREMVDTFIKQRYTHYENAISLALVLNELDCLIEDQRAVMVVKEMALGKAAFNNNIFI